MLSVAPDGRALFAHDGQGMVQVYERGSGEPAFARVRRLRSRLDTWERPEVAVAADGSALVAWRGEEDEGAEDVLALSRRGAGAWTGPVAVHRNRRADASLGEAYAILFSTSRKPSPPDDSGNTGLRVAIGPDGSFLVSWGMERRLPLGDRSLAARMVEGEAGGGVSLSETAGCRCRSVNGVLPLELAGGELLLGYTDNVTRFFDLGLEFPTGSGRLHLAEAGPPGPGGEPPRLGIRAPRATTLGYGNRLSVRVGCDRACDLRAYVAGGRGRMRGVAVATLGTAGTTRRSLGEPIRTGRPRPQAAATAAPGPERAGRQAGRRRGRDLGDGPAGEARLLPGEGPPLEARPLPRRRGVRAGPRQAQVQAAGPAARGARARGHRSNRGERGARPPAVRQADARRPCLWVAQGHCSARQFSTCSSSSSLPSFT